MSVTSNEPVVVGQEYVTPVCKGCGRTDYECQTPPYWEMVCDSCKAWIYLVHTPVDSGKEFHYAQVSKFRKENGHE